MDTDDPAEQSQFRMMGEDHRNRAEQVEHGAGPPPYSHPLFPQDEGSKPRLRPFVSIHVTRLTEDGTKESAPDQLDADSYRSWKQI